MSAEPVPWEPPDFGESIAKKLIAHGVADAQRQKDINAIVLAEAGDTVKMLMHARTMFVNARMRGDKVEATHWASIGLSLAAANTIDYSDKD
jgi:hypothetical protein